MEAKWLRGSHFDLAVYCMTMDGATTPKNLDIADYYGADIFAAGATLRPEFSIAICGGTCHLRPSC